MPDAGAQDRRDDVALAASVTGGGATTKPSGRHSLVAAMSAGGRERAGPGETPCRQMMDQAFPLASARCRRPDTLALAAFRRGSVTARCRPIPQLP